MKGHLMQSGIVKWFDPEKGFGFITPDEGEGDVFVHITAVSAAGLSHLEANQRVRFELKARRDGRESAQDLVLL